MKNHRRVIFIAIFAFAAASFLIPGGGKSCAGGSDPLYENEIGMKVLFKSLIKERLRDPDSYEFISLRPGTQTEHGRYYIFTYRAKNGFGGYNVCEAIVFCNANTMNLISIPNQ